jgi:hypothetical protein
MAQNDSQISFMPPVYIPDQPLISARANISVLKLSKMVIDANSLNH